MQVVEWFAATHTLQQDAWVPFGLPAAGALENQNAWLMNGIAYARNIAQAMLRERSAALTALTQPATPRSGTRTDG